MRMIKSLVVSMLLLILNPAAIYADGHASPAVEAAIDALKDHIDNHVGEGQLDDQDKDGLKAFAKSLEEAVRAEHQEGGCENCAGDVMTEISDWASNLEWSDGQDQGEFVMALMDLYSDLENAIHQEENESHQAEGGHHEDGPHHNCDEGYWWCALCEECIPEEDGNSHHAEMHEGEPHEGSGPSFADVDANQDGVISYEEASEAFGHEDDFEEKFAEVDSDGDGELTPEEFHAASPPEGGATVIHVFDHIDGDGNGELDENEALTAYPDSDQEEFEMISGGDGSIDRIEYYNRVTEGMKDFQDEGAQPISSWGDWTLHNCAALCAGLESIPDENDDAVSVEQGQENGCPCAQTGPPPNDY